MGYAYELVDQNRKHRNRPTWTEKKAAVAAIRNDQREATSPCPAMVHSVAERFGVTERAVQLWLADPRLGDQTSGAPQRKRLEITDVHLAVIAQERTLSGAHARLKANGLVKCGYSTFARAFATRTDPAIAQGTLHGGKAMINSRTYLSNRAPHRNHTWHIDHTELDIRVIPNHRYKRAIRPWVTAVVDSATGYVLAYVPWRANPNQEAVAATLAAASVLRLDNGVEVGGSPGLIVCDNAREHFGQVVLGGVERMGWHLAPTGTYSGFQNGPAERALGILNQHFANKMPGATNGGTTRSGAPRHTTSDPTKVNPEETLSWNAFTHLLEAFRQQHNRTVSQRSRGGQTRLEAWAADPTELAAPHPDLIRYNMMRGDRNLYSCSKAGLTFRNAKYINSTLNVKQWYEIRYFESIETYVEVFDDSGTYVGRAWRNDDVPEAEANAHQETRKQQEAAVARAQDGAQQHRKHYAQVANQECGGQPVSIDPTLAELESAIFARREEDEQNAAAGADKSARTRRSRNSRSGNPLPPVNHAVGKESAQTAATKAKANARLAANMNLSQKPETEAAS